MLPESAPSKDGLPVLRFASAADWASWLAEHEGDPGEWLEIAKKASGFPSVTHKQALDVALCHGWIDGLRHAVDGTWFRQRFIPRRRRSNWSKINCAWRCWRRGRRCTEMIIDRHGAS